MRLDNEPAINLTPEEWLPYEELIQRFEQAWEDGNQPALQDYLAPGGDWPWAALVELAHVDLEYRLKAGEAARVEEYWRCYPALAEHAETAVALIVAEYEVRGRNESGLGRAEYLTRFPQYEGELCRAWETRVRAAPNTPPVAATSPDSARPSHLGKYELLEIVGRGAFGVVYRARDAALDRTVAIKVPRLDRLSFPEEADRFLREARSAAQLQHPHIVTLYEVCQTDHTIYLVYEFVKGKTLAEHLTAARLLPVQSAELLAQIAEALDYAHGRGVIHRDLKPANILLDAAGQPHVLDFGLAKRDVGEKTLTVAGEVLGTPAYMSPEQARGDAHGVDARSDVYSLGVVFYELLTSDRPFRGNSRMLLKQVLEDDPRDPRRLNDQIPRDLETICLKCLRKEARERYPSAGALANDLRRFLAGEPIAARPVGAMMRGVKWVKRRPALAGSLAVSALALLSLAAVGFWFAAREGQHALLESQQADEARKQALTARRYQYAAEMNLAYEARDNFRLEQAQELLERQRPEPGQLDLRSFEWYYLWRQCQRDLLLRGHTGLVNCLAISPDGRLLASGSRDKTVKIWDTATWTERLTLRGHSKMVYCLAFAPDGKTLATGSNDSTVKLWDTSTWQELATISPRAGALSSVAFSPDSRTLAYSAGNDGVVKLWDVAGGNEQAALLAPIRHKATSSHVIYSVVFSPDGKTLAASYWEDMTIKLWDLATRQVRAVIAGSSPYDVVFSPDGKTLAAGNGAKIVKLWDAGTGQTLHTLEGHTREVRSVGFSPDGKTLATVGEDETVRIWDISGVNQSEVLHPRFTLHGHTGRVQAVAFTRDGQTLATAGEDKSIRLWDPHTGRARRRQSVESAAGKDRVTQGPSTHFADDAEPLELGDHGGVVRSVAFSPDGKILGSASSRLDLWDAATGRKRLSFAAQAVNALFLPEGRTAAVVIGGSVELWDVATGQMLGTFEGRHRMPVYAMALSPDGRMLATGGGNFGEPGELKLWDVATRQEQVKLPGHPDVVRSAAFSPDGKTLATGSADETVKLWDVTTGQERATLHGHQGYVYSLAFAPDGQTLASGSADSTIKLWDLATRQERATLQGHRGPIFSIAITPDGKTLASGSQDATVMLWDMATGQGLAILKAHTDRINSVAFSPDGKILASGGFDGKVFLWHAASEDESARPAIDNASQ